MRRRNVGNRPYEKKKRRILTIFFFQILAQYIILSGGKGTMMTTEIGGGDVRAERIAPIVYKTISQTNFGRSPQACRS